MKAAKEPKGCGEKFPHVFGVTVPTESGCHRTRAPLESEAEGEANKDVKNEASY